MSDTHFGHANIIKYEAEARPFACLHDMHEAMIEKWNAVVKPEDTVWHLGDVCFGQDNLAIVARLNGYKKLILGNHDHYGAYYHYFSRIFGVADFKKRTILSHIPVSDKQFGRYNANIHGHLHSKSYDDPRYINVSVERWGLAPVSWDILKEKVKDVT